MSGDGLIYYNVLDNFDHGREPVQKEEGGKTVRQRNKRLLYYGGVILLGIVVVFVVIQAMLHIGAIGKALAGVIAALRAILVGIVMAYLLYPLARFAEQFLLYHKVKKRIARTISTLFSLLVLLVLLVAFAYFIIPQLVVSLPPLMQNLPGMMDSFAEQTTDFFASHGVSTEVITDIFARIEAFMKNWLNDDPLSTLAELMGRVMNFAQSILNFVIGIIVMVYVLLGRDQFVGQGKKILYASIKRRSTCDTILRHMRNINKIFSGFVSGKLMDSLIIGIICGIVLSILRIPYAPLISVVVGVTNIIPVFGPFFGAIPSALLLLLTDPGKCIIFLIFIVVLQQVDGNIIGPKILGDSTGLSAFWVLFALLLFNHIMGFWGMLLGVPLFASFYYLFREFINAKLRKKDLPIPSEDYVDIVGISPAGVISYADPQRIEFPALIVGENSLASRLRGRIRKTEKSGEDPGEDPPEPPEG